MELTAFKYKRRCSIFKDDLMTEKCNGQEDLQCLSPGLNRKEILNNNVIKSNVQCDVSKDLTHGHTKRQSLTNSSDAEHSFCNDTSGESTGKTGTCDGIQSDIKSTRETGEFSLNLSETEQDFGIGESSDSGRLTPESNGSAFTTDESILDEDGSFEDDGVEYKLEKLKGIFNDAFSDGVLLEVLRDTNGLDHATAVLLDFPASKWQKSNPEKGKNGSECSILKPSKDQKKRTTSDKAFPVDLSAHHDQMPTKHRRLEDKEDESTIKTNKESLVNSSVCIIGDEKYKKSFTKLKKQFPTHDVQVLLDVLESNGGSLDDAIASVEAFSSSEKTLCNKKSEKKEKPMPTAVIVVDDESDDGDITQSKKPSANSWRTIMSSDEEQMYDSQSEDEDMSSDEKAAVLSMLDSHDVSEIALVRDCSMSKAEKIVSLRPFKNWDDLMEKFQKTKGLNEGLLWQCSMFVIERNKMERLIDECETISNDLKGLFKVTTVESEDPSENQHKIEMKEQCFEKEPSIVAPGFKLKSYQFTGLNWLITIHKKEVNGILADEMGLGKTIQTIVFLAYLIEQGDTGPYLIVVPSSTIDNWKRELNQWCPSIQCLLYRGSQEERRAIRDEVNYATEYDFHILLTTYNTAVSTATDRVFLKKCNFHYAVFDEAHMMKNMKTARYQLLLKIHPRRMLLLTGTPIQNNLLEILSLLAFLMPTLFAERLEGMKLLFGDGKGKLTKETSYQKEQVIKVKKILEPFVMRRLKKDVLSKLPAKHEHIVEIEVPQRQRRICDAAFASSAKIVNSDDGKCSGATLSGLCMQLRHSANHPLLLRNYYDDVKLFEMAQKYCRAHRDSDVNLVFEDMQIMSDFELRGLCLEERSLKEYELPHELVMDCGKFIYLDSVLPNMKEKGDRVLLFNQFTLMMDIVEVYLQTRNYNYLRLDGQTMVSKRQDLIDTFNTDDDIFIFLLSTKAGGLGINLTSANVVILSDSDFNPHNDKQAEDRCHRLGQTREVNVYRFITKETIEESILKLARKKIRLHDDISQSKEGNKDSDKNDIQSLMKAVFGKHRDNEKSTVERQK